MDPATLAIYITAGLAIIVAVIGYLLSKKDSSNEKAIDDLKMAQKALYLASEAKEVRDRVDADVQKLFDLHAADAQRLNELELSVARNQYSKSEIDNLFGMMRTALNDGFREMKDAIQEIRVDISHLKNGNVNSGK